MKKLLTLLVALILVAPKAMADEGMWLLPLIEKLNYNKMRDMGLKLTAEEIYSINEKSLKDAIMIFGRGCTGEVISSKGLLLTNHHCGYDAIQQHSTVEHDYLKDGFWAMSLPEEIPTPGLSVKFIKKIVDVTEAITKGTHRAKTEQARRDIIAKNTKKLISKTSTKKFPGSFAMVQEFFGGNQYIMFIVQEFNDVRMVGVPPSSIGKFGGDTDNWMWPRHTGDFSIFRIYADENNNPAKYSKDNVPYNAPRHLKISLKGVQENDFAMILGFPGSTQRYMTSFEVEERMNLSNNIRIYVRGVRQDILMEDMIADPKVKIQYSSKYAYSSNFWKNSIGMNKALTKLDVKGDKEKLEKDFNAWAKSDPARNDKYANATTLIKNAVEGRKNEYNALLYYNEAYNTSVEIFSIAGIINQFAKSNKFNVEKAKEIISEFYKNYNMPTDKKVTAAMIELFQKSVPAEFQPKEFNALIEKNGSIQAFVDNLFENSVFASEEKALAAIENINNKPISDDIAVIANGMVKKEAIKYQKDIAKYNDMLKKGHRLFIAGLIEMKPEKAYYPDANFTLRMTYGKVAPYSPKDGVIYDYTTTLAGVIEKEDPKNPYEFTVHPKLKELYNAKDYGQYAEKCGEVITCFITDHDITGGNSGSPTLNAKGELIGTAFDGNWEAMSGDIAFEPALQRTIICDIRYVLFIVDKFAGATHLIEEMDIVN